MQGTQPKSNMNVAPDTVAKMRHLALEWRRLAEQTRSEAARVMMTERAEELEAALRRIEQPSLFNTD